MKPTEINIQYDDHDPTIIGKPKHFCPDHYCDSIEQMMAADEVILALQMLNNPPGFYRQSPTQRMIDLKRDIYKHTWSMTNYAQDEDECYDRSLELQRKYNPGHKFDDLGNMIDIPFCFPRGPLMVDTVKAYNDQGLVPFIWEMGPANFWLPHGLIKKGLKFKYFATSLNKKALEDNKERLKDVWQDKPDKSDNPNFNQPEIFVCFEVIEHLWNLNDILHQYQIYGANAETILLSTPLNTLLGGVPEWKRDIGHLRTFTSKELALIAESMFPGYDWQSAAYALQVVRGVKRG